MNTEEVKALQAPIKDRHRKEPQATLITLRAQALVACAGVTLKAVATALAIDLRDAQVTAEGDRGLDTDASDEHKKKLLELTERYCVVLQTLRHSPITRVAC